MMFSDGAADRAFWFEELKRIATPVLTALADGQLRQRMPIQATPGEEESRARHTHLEALGRTLAGIAPWLECGGLTGTEEDCRAELAGLARRAIAQATDPDSADYCNFAVGHQPVVDAAFLAHGLLRAPTQLWEKLDASVRANVVRCLRATRAHPPGFSNWLLFSAMIEAWLASVGEEWDGMRVDYAIRQHEQWYKGDGVYGDGPFFHWDYYNSFVIQPMLADVLRIVALHTARWSSFEPATRARLSRYAAVQERLIAPDGSFPVLGRSMCYRFGAFQALAQAALLGWLPPELPPSQVRCALTAVIRRVMAAPETFDADGWLTVGLCGRQPSLAEPYISTGSLYLCLCGLLPLGLPPENSFWSGPARSWTNLSAWSGHDLAGDHSLLENG